MLEGILFDLENTLVVRESYRREIDQVIFDAIAQTRSCGIAEARLMFTEMRTCFSTTSATLEALRVPKEELHTRLERVKLSNPVAVTEGMPDVLYRLVAQGLKLGLVTNMPKGLTLTILSSAGIPKDLFAAIVTGSDTCRPKPALEPFCLATHLMALCSRHCMMVGDREEVDLDPARELGMITVLVSSAALRADYALASLSELECLIVQQYGSGVGIK